MVEVKVNTQKIIGKIKPMHSVSMAPVGGSGKNCFSNFHYLTEAGIPYSRLHDMGILFGGKRFVDVSNIFKDFDADENNPENYDFTFTDALITALKEAGCEPYYRLGETIENQAEIKAYNIFPPKDFDKWARICEHIVAHYNEGWANGFFYDIKYWEVWCEPDDCGFVGQLWKGTPEEYFSLYETTSKRLKACFPNIKIGGYGAVTVEAGLLNEEEYKNASPKIKSMLKFFKDFISYVKEKDCPIDFFSWHCYHCCDHVIDWSKYVIKYLTENGLGDIEIHLNEYNPVYATGLTRCTGAHAAHTLAIILAMQDSKVDMCNFYDARLVAGKYSGLFNPLTITPSHAYYSLVAFNTLYKLGSQVEVVSNKKGFYAVGASNGNSGALLISNISGEDQTINIEGVNLSNARYHVIDEQRLLSWSPAVSVVKNNTVLLVEY